MKSSGNEGDLRWSFFIGSSLTCKYPCNKWEMSSSHDSSGGPSCAPNSPSAQASSLKRSRDESQIEINNSSITEPGISDAKKPRIEQLASCAAPQVK